MWPHIRLHSRQQFAAPETSFVKRGTRKHRATVNEL